MEAFKPIQELSKKLFPYSTHSKFNRATFIRLVILGFLVSFILEWSLGNSNISHHYWSEIFEEIKSYYVWFPAIIGILIAQITINLSPQQKLWSRFVIVSLLLFLICRYLIWRGFYTLNLSDPLNSVFSLGLFLMELILILSYSFKIGLQLKIKSRHREADQMSIAVIEGKYTPSVDIFIPTYNEPTHILRRTVIGCQAVDYFRKKVYLLDDSQRSEVKKLAEELGCEYMTRPDNQHAKAGNLNHALAKTSGDLIAVFDADFVPTTNFLTRTVGFFQNPKIALVQTYQNFYNPDPIARNLGLEDLIPRDNEAFFRHIQLIKDSLGSALCVGTSFIVRRRYLEEVRGFVTESLSEDFFTGIRLSSQGYKVIYLGESLSAGLSAETIRAYIQQQLRWCRGTLQAFFIKENPLTIPGLNFLQRLIYLEGIIQWFSFLVQAIFFSLPVFCLVFRIIPFKVTINEFIYYFIPLYLIQLITSSWLSYRSVSVLINNIYLINLCFPLAVNVIHTLLSPFSVKFRVTPKGILSDRTTFNWPLALPLFMFLGINIISLIYSYVILKGEGIQLMVFWSIYNTIIIGFGLLALFDVPKSDIYEWFNLQKTVRLFNGKDTVKGVTTKISEGGAEIKLSQPLEFTPSVTLEILENGLILQGKVVETQLKGNSATIRVNFEKMNLEDYRSLVELLFCRPGRWKLRQAPNELHSFWLLLKVLVRPKFLKFRQSS